MSGPQNNKQIVTDFFDLVFNQHKVDEGMDAYLGPTYTQHNPEIADGPEAVAYQSAWPRE